MSSKSHAEVEQGRANPRRHEPINHAEWYLLGLAAILMVLVFILAARAFYL